MSFTESHTFKEIVNIIGQLGNIGTLSPDDQQQRVIEKLGTSHSFGQINIHDIAVRSNLTYSTIMLILRIGEFATRKKTEKLQDLLECMSFKPPEALLALAKKNPPQQQQLTHVDEPKMEEMEIIED
ncbi:hypothetical protein RclHR1_00930002 [Rhizophagus clarus]|uniref:Uncharacterized protein n=1 Tax=Rhizophagus clarus TaxID=94130 RepID=A0A2Z6S3Z3_9GLOM|nr:hypothetical protein RclHR1_00930002 [Rhizophagus clarus]